MTAKPSQNQLEGVRIEEIERGFLRLLGISLDAYKFYPPLYISSILGKPLTAFPIHPYSEYTLIDPWHPLRTMRILVNVTVPSIPIKPPPLTPPFLDEFFFRPTKILHRPDHTHDYTTFLDEAWFFINGIMTNDDVAQLNAAYISDLFHRPVTIIQNTTQSCLIDLIECAFDKEWQSSWGDIREASRKAFPPIYDALKNPAKRKVVVLAHSQGTIIMSVVLNMLKSITKIKKQPAAIYVNPPTSALAIEAKPKSEIGSTAAVTFLEFAAPSEPIVIFPYEGMLEPDDFSPLSEDEFAKLEIYCFANCANQMTYLREPGMDQPIPWIENFGNEFDVVARLGMLAPRKEKRQINISGPIYCRPGGWGHLMNEHYLKPIDKAQRVRLKQGGQNRNKLAPYNQLTTDPQTASMPPRLLDYINGGKH